MLDIDVGDEFFGADRRAPGARQVQVFSENVLPASLAGEIQVIAVGQRS